MNIIAISVRSNFIGSNITAFHSVMFHGVAGRAGRRFPNDQPPVWNQNSEALELAVNIRTTAKFTVPGYYPVVSKDIFGIFASYNSVTAGEVKITRCIDLPWSMDEPPVHREFEESYFDDSSYQCRCPETPTDLFELILRQHASVSSEKLVTIETDLGTSPLQKRVTLQVPEEWIRTQCAFASGRNFFFDEKIFSQISPFVPHEFFVIRNCKIT